MPERRCGNCRFWEYGQAVERPLPTATSNVQGACTRFGNSLTEGHPRYAVDVPGWETTQAYIGLDHGAHVALFMTQDDFSCAQFEASDA